MIRINFTIVLIIKLLIIITKGQENYLLPKTIKPLEYDISLIPYLTDPPIGKNNFTFDGQINIKIEPLTNTNQIVLHAYDIDIISAIVTNNNVIGYFFSNDSNNFLTLQLELQLQTSVIYDLNITYIGKLNDKLEGFYRSYYTDSLGDRKWLAISQFAAVGARRAFPCWDEPNWKAKFILRIAHAPDYIVQSNMGISKEIPLTDPNLTGWNFTEFNQSKLMSSYIVAFSVNQFDFITHGSDARFKVWARPEAIDQGYYGLNIAPNATKYMELYTNFNYPLDKLDQIAIPDFVFNAMENWGMITYRETALLFTENKSTSYDHQRVETIVTHETAHQWFGDLITPNWWDIVWLSEGFATFFEYHALAAYRTDWDLKEQFVQRETQAILQIDATENTHPLQTVVNSSYAANAAFDDLVYQKGGSLVRMLENLMTVDNFRIGLSDYINKKQYSNVVMDDLWSSLELSLPSNFLPENITLKEIMDSWTLQSGYPVVTINRNYNTNEILITQKRFLTQNNGTIYNETWWIPLTFTTSNNTNFQPENLTVIWHNGSELILNNLTSNSNEWLICNIQHYGYYRVNYDIENWKLLSLSQLNLHQINRAQLMDDALSLARSGLLDYPTAINTTNYLNMENLYVPWAAGLSSLTYLYDRLSNESNSRLSIEQYLFDKLQPVYNNLGSLVINISDTHVIRLKRNLIYGWSCLINIFECTNDAQILYQNWKLSSNPDVNNPIDPDLKSIVYCEGMRRGNANDYNFLFDRYKNASNYATEQKLVLDALGCATDESLLIRYLNESITINSGIRSQDSKSVIESIYKNYWGVDVALDFLLTRYYDILNFYGSFGNIESVFYGISLKLNTQEHKNKLETFLNTNDVGEADAAVRAAIKNVDEILIWHQLYRDIVINFFESL